MHRAARGGKGAMPASAFVPSAPKLTPGVPVRPRRSAGRDRSTPRAFVCAASAKRWAAPHRRASCVRLTIHLQHGQAFVRQQRDGGAETMGESAVAVVDDPTEGIGRPRRQLKGNALGHADQIHRARPSRGSPAWFARHLSRPTAVLAAVGKASTQPTCPDVPSHLSSRFRVPVDQRSDSTRRRCAAVGWSCAAISASTTPGGAA